MTWQTLLLISESNIRLSAIRAEKRAVKQAEKAEREAIKEAQRQAAFEAELEAQRHFFAKDTFFVQVVTILSWRVRFFSTFCFPVGMFDTAINSGYCIKSPGWTESAISNDMALQVCPDTAISQ